MYQRASTNGQPQLAHLRIGPDAIQLFFSLLISLLCLIANNGSAEDLPSPHKHQNLAASSISIIYEENDDNLHSAYHFPLGAHFIHDEDEDEEDFELEEDLEQKTHHQKPTNESKNLFQQRHNRKRRKLRRAAAALNAKSSEYLLPENFASVTPLKPSFFVFQSV